MLCDAVECRRLVYHDERSVYSLFDILKEFEEGLSDGLRGQSASRDALPDIIELIDAPTLALTVRPAPPLTISALLVWSVHSFSTCVTVATFA